MKKIIVFLIIIFFIIISSFLYMNIKKQTVVKEVQEYLIEEKGVEKNDIIDLEPIISNLSGNKNILVYVKLKNDNKKYYYS